MRFPPASRIGGRLLFDHGAALLGEIGVILATTVDADALPPDVHLHQRSVARRIERLGADLGIELTEPSGLVRATLALAASRLVVPIGDVD